MRATCGSVGFRTRQYNKWSQDPAEKRRWTEALEKWGPKRVEAELSDRALGSSACINVGETRDVVVGFIRDWLAWREQNQINWTMWGVGGPMSTIGFHHLIQRLGKTAKMPFPLHPHMLRHACGYKLANDGTIPEPCSTISVTRTSSTPSDTPSFHPTGSGTSGEIRLEWRPRRHRGSHWHGSAHLKRAWMYVRQTRPPGRGDCGILKIIHAPSPKNVFKNGF